MALMNNVLSFTLMVLSASLIAFGSFARKCLVGVDGIYITMFVCFVGGAIVMWWIVSISSFQKIKPTAWKSIFIRVILSLLAQLFFFISLSKGSLLITILLFNTSPLFVPVIRLVFYKYKISIFNFACILVSFIGIYLILGAGEGKVTIYSISAILAGILNAASQVVLHSASQKEDTFIMNLWIYTFIGLIILVLLPFNIYSINNLENIFTQPVIIWICIAIMTFGISAQIFRVKAFKYTKDPALVAPAMYFSVVVAALIDIVFYHTSISFLEMCGILMVCASSILAVVNKSK
jgi:drug/metabolite transporter (DMT)-like permease